MGGGAARDQPLFAAIERHIPKVHERLDVPLVRPRPAVGGSDIPVPAWQGKSLAHRAKITAQKSGVAWRAHQTQ